MIYFIVTILLFLCLLLYFRLADHFNIIDKPNERSSHSEITLRGGGVIYPIAFIFFLIIHFFFETDKQLLPLEDYLIFGAGLMLISGISFIDDLVDLSSKIRLLFHFVAVCLLLFFLRAFKIQPYYVIPILFIVIIGILNAFNFMDGINGLTGLYSLTVLGSLWYVNSYVTEFVSADFIIFPCIASAIFLFFNYRKKAKCFLGDVGSMAVVFWIMALLGLLMIKTQDLKYILFLTVYGLDVITTILERLKLKENIFKAHRRHLYQLLANEKKLDHRAVSLSYAVVQLAINAMVINSQWHFITLFGVLIMPLFALYIILKINIKNTI